MRKATDNPHDFIVSDEQRTLPDGTPCRLFIVEDTTDNTFHPFANYGGKVSTSPMPCGSLAGAREWLQTFFLQMQE